MIRNILIAAALTTLGVTAVQLAGCSDAQVASRNLSTAADNFEINRRIIFYNGITGAYILTIEGRCSQDPDGNNGRKLSVTCKVGPNAYKKHFLGLSDNVTYFSEQMEPVPVDVYQYRVVLKPTVVLPSFEVKTPGSATTKTDGGQP